MGEVTKLDDSFQLVGEIDTDGRVYEEDNDVHANVTETLNRLLHTATMFDGWDDVRPTSECRHCQGTGMADEHNECGFCEAP